MAKVTLEQIAAANPVAQANASFINALYQYGFGRKAKKNELAKFAGKSVKDAANLVLGQKKSPFARGTQAPVKGTPAAVASTPTPQDPLEGILGELTGILDDLANQGQTVNPNVEITPEKAAEFLKQAEGEIDPYYTGQLSLAREGILASFGYTAEDVARFEGDLERRFKKQFRQIGEQSADTGFALSGRRQREETEETEETGRVVERGRTDASRRSAELARAFAQLYGGTALKGLTVPSFGELRVGKEGFERGTGQSPLYSLPSDIYDALTGEREFERRSKVSSRTSELESAYRRSELAKRGISI